MDPDFVLSQARGLSYLFAANASHAQERRVFMQDVFLHPEFAQDQVEALESAVGDAMLLHKLHGKAHSFAVTQGDFSLKQNELQRVALKDNADLQSAVPESQAKIDSLGSQYVLDVMELLERVLYDNAKLATEQAINLNELNMAKPISIAKTLGWLRSTVQWHVRLQEEFQSLHKAHADTKARVDQLIEENTQFLAAHQTAERKCAKLQTSLARLQQEKQTLVQETNAAQSRIDQLTEELLALPDVHANCEAKHLEFVDEVALMKDAVKELVKVAEEHATAAASSAEQVNAKDVEFELLGRERNEVVLQFLELRKSHETQCSTLVTELKQKIAEMQEQVMERDATVANLEATVVALQAHEGQLQGKLSSVKAQLASSDVHCDTWRSLYDALLVQHHERLEQAQNTTAQEQQFREEADVLLHNAARKIEELEHMLREKDEQVASLRAAAAEQEAKRRGSIAGSISSRSTTVSSRKRGHAVMKAGPSWSSGNVGHSLDLAAHGVPLPPTRAAPLAAFPVVSVDFGSSGPAPEIFTRQSLSNILGGSVQGLVVRCTESATALARKHDISDYLCPNMDHNAWSPPGPGQHGYMQVGLGRDRKLFNDQGEYRHVFVGAGKFFLYCGWYHVLRVGPLSKEEWETLPAKVKSTYSETTFNKEKTKNCTDKPLWDTVTSSGQVLEMYNRGELRAPLVRLQCLEFNTAFYQELVRANAQYYSDKQRPALPNSAKRRKVADESVTNEKAEDEVPTVLADENKTEDIGPTSTLVDGPIDAPPPPSVSGTSDNTVVSAPDVEMGAVSRPAPATPVKEAPSSTRQTRYSTRQRSTGVVLKLRIPGGRSPRSAGGAKDTDEEREIEENMSSDDDDLYMD